MTNFARWIFATALISTPALAQTASPASKSATEITQSTLIRKFTAAIAALAGRQTTFGDWYGIKADCTPLDWNEIIIMNPPQHGTAHVVDMTEPINFPDSNPRKACNGKPVAAKVLTYSPDKDFAGSDRMVVQKISSNGIMESVTYNITVVHDDAPAGARTESKTAP